MSSTVRPVILSGGSGTRLWPLSTPKLPKQFLELAGPPLLEQALRRLDGLPNAGDPVVVTGAAHLSLVENALDRLDLTPFRLVVEPVGRNTGPAVTAAALVLDPDEVMVVLPADHLIARKDAYLAAVSTAVARARAERLVTFGVVPTRPETGFGYMELGDPDGESGAFEVDHFTEKPDAESAQEMVAGGRHLWNSGMFVFRAGTYLGEAARLAPGMVTAVSNLLPGIVGSVVNLGDDFDKISPISVDQAVMEKTDRATVIPIDVGWSDVGSWQALWEGSPHDAAGNVLVGDVSAVDVRGSYLRSDDGKLAVAGLEDVVVVATADAVLVVSRDMSQHVGQFAPELEE